MILPDLKHAPARGKTQQMLSSRHMFHVPLAKHWGFSTVFDPRQNISAFCGIAIHSSLLILSSSCSIPAPVLRLQHIRRRIDQGIAAGRCNRAAALSSPGHNAGDLLLPA